MSKIEEKDRRRFVRLKAYHLVKYRLLSEEKEKTGFILGAIEEIGGGGVRLSVEEEIPLSSLIELSINFPHVSTSLFALAKVVWIKRRPKSRRFEAGAQFVQIDDPVRSLINDQVKSVFKRMKDKKTLALFDKKGEAHE